MKNDVIDMRFVERNKQVSCNVPEVLRTKTATGKKNTEREDEKDRFANPFRNINPQFLFAGA